MVIFIIGNIIQITAMDSWVHMMMGRFVAGLGVGNLSVGVPMFQSECSPREIRGAVVASYQLMITIGILVSNLINFGVRNIQDSSASWRIVIGLGIAFSLPLGIGVMLVPESPRWLAGRQDWEGARKALARLRGMKDDPGHPLVEQDIQEMFAIIEAENRVGVGGWLECFSDKRAGIPKVLYRTILGVTIHFLQQVRDNYQVGVNIADFLSGPASTTFVSSVGVEQRGLTISLLWRDNLRVGRYPRPAGHPAHPWCRQRRSHVLRLVRGGKVRSSMATVHRCAMAGCVVACLCHRGHCIGRGE